MDISTFLSRYLGLLFVCCGFHLTYFQLFRYFAPSIAKDRKRLAWILTFTTAFFVSVIAPFYTWGGMRTIFSSPTLLDTQHPGFLGNNLNHNHINNGGHHLVSAEFNSNDFASLGQDSQGLRRSQPNVMIMDPSLHGMQKKTERLIAQKEDNEKQFGSKEEERSEEGAHQAITEDSGDKGPQSPSILNKQDQGMRQFRLFFDMRFTPDDNEGTIALVVFFMAYLIMDITLGLLYYREQVTLLAGWLHHTAYIGITYYAVTQGETFTYAMFLPMEVPTIVVGVGCLDKSLRRDMLYGFSFIIFRILFDFSLTHEVVWNREREMTTTLKTILIFKSLMNLKFLQGWISQQKRLARRRRAEAAAKATTSMEVEAANTAAVDEKKIVSITAPAITSRMSVHVKRQEHRGPVSREDESSSRRSVRIRSKGIQETDFVDTQPMIAVH